MIAASAQDYRELALRRPPPFLFEYIDGGSYAEVTLARNVDDLRSVALRQRLLRDVSAIDLMTELFGQKMAFPVMLRPIGLAGMNARRGEVQGARAAEKAGIPFTLSTVSACPIAEVAAGTSTPFRFQLYMIRDRSFMRELMVQAIDAVCSTLVSTVDMPVPSSRHRDYHSGLADASAYRGAPRRMFQGAFHPRWAWAYALAGASERGARHLLQLIRVAMALTGRDTHRSNHSRHVGRDARGKRMTDHEKMTPAEHWKTTILAGLANYIDAGSIVAGSVALALWKELYNLSDNFIGLIGAFSANAISAGVGALAGGWLCDRFGRKKIYQYDMLVYAFGMAFLVFASAPWMIVVGFVIVGFAVGADIPASWSLIAEMAPEGERGKHSGVAQVLWYLGPVVVLLMSLALTNLGILGARIVFAHLLVIALAMTLLRSRMRESHVWETARNDDSPKVGARELLQPRYVKSLAALIGMYGFWNLWAGTNGFFFPYILRTVGAASQATSVAIQALSFAIGMASIGLVFMRLSDKVNQRKLFAWSAIIQVIGMALLAVFPLTLPVALLYVFLLQFGGGFGAQSFFQLWSSEMFPTLLRSTAQGVAFAVVRIGLGIFSFFVPYLTATGFTTLAWILTGFLMMSGIIGLAWAPRNEGKSLHQLEQERAVA